MPYYAMIRHSVEDFPRWKQVFDANESWRKGSGEQHFYVFRDADSPEEVIVLEEFADLQTARSYVRSPELLEKMRESGVTGDAVIYYLDEVDSSFMKG